MQIENTLLLLFLIASAVAIVARRLNIPYTVSLVVVGLGLGVFHLVQAPKLTKDVLFLVFLPGLIFEAAFNIRFANLWQDRLPILGMAIPGVILSIGLTASLLVLATTFFHDFIGINVQPIGWAVAFIFAAAVAATDPIAVVALFRRLGVPSRLTLLLEGESLLNDGTSIVFFGLVLSYIANQASGLEGTVVEFGQVVGGGLLIGSLVGLFASFVLRRIDDMMIEITITMLVAYGSFWLGEHFWVSGVISTVVAGLICGNYSAKQRTVSLGNLHTMRSFWAYMGFALNSLVFLLMGMEIKLDSLLSIWPLILLSWLVATLARGLIVTGALSLLHFTPGRIPKTWGAILIWGGLRGAVSMVLALSLPADLPARETIINLVFGFVLLSILLQGLSMTTLARRLGLIAGERLETYETAVARQRIAKESLREVNRLRKSQHYDNALLDTLDDRYQKINEQAQSDINALDIDSKIRWQADWDRLQQHMLSFKRKQLADAYRNGEICETAYKQLLTDLDARNLEAGTVGNAPPMPHDQSAQKADRLRI